MKKKKLSEKQQQMMINVTRREKKDLLRGEVYRHKGKSVDVVISTTGAMLSINVTKRHDIIVGDVVFIDSADSEAKISMRDERKNCLMRLDNHLRQPIVSNIDRAYIVIASQPATWAESLAQYYTYLRFLKIQPAFIVNKIDLGPLSDQMRERLNYFQQHLRVPVFFVSVYDDLSLQKLKSHLVDGVSIFIGPSGVGKSSLIKAILGDTSIVIGELSQALKGKHTTSVTQKYELISEKSWLIDSPGVRQSGLGPLLREEILCGFPDFGEFSCQFRNCDHIDSHGCAVKKAVEEKKLPLHRYQDYLFLCEKFLIQSRHERHF